jgi:hypothetical protein
MTINLYTKGQKVRCVVSFTVDGTLTDPTTVTFKSMDPGGNVSIFVYGTDNELVKDSTGIYYADVITDENGEWNFRFEGTGACEAVEEQAFNVTSVF